MSFFTELYALAQHNALTLQIVADANSGRMTINVRPKVQADAGEPALATPLSLTATPEEFDAGFVPALRDYRQAHASLAQQAAATAQVLAAARTASQRRATQAAGGAGRGPACKGYAPQGTLAASDSDGDPDGVDAEADGAPQGSPASGGHDANAILDLFG